MLLFFLTKLVTVSFDKQLSDLWIAYWIESIERKLEKAVEGMGRLAYELSNQRQWAREWARELTREWPREWSREWVRVSMRVTKFDQYEVVESESLGITLSWKNGTSIQEKELQGRTKHQLVKQLHSFQDSTPQQGTGIYWCWHIDSPINIILNVLSYKLKYQLNKSKICRKEEPNKTNKLNRRLKNRRLKDKTPKPKTSKN